MATLVTGNTFPVKDQLRALGGRWDAKRKGWLVPEQHAEKAFALVQSAPRQSTAPANYRRRSGMGRRTGCACGSIDGVSRASDCWTCRHDAE